MIYVIAHTYVFPQHHEAYKRDIHPFLEATRQEAGCLHYDSHQSLTDPNLFVTNEQWETREALAVHVDLPHMHSWRELSGPYRASQTKVRIIYPAEVEMSETTAPLPFESAASGEAPKT